jgi:hypothetical protein
MEATEFCERWFGIHDLPDDQKREVVSQARYRAQCVHLLCTVLQKPHKTVRNWGQQFERMPEADQTALLYADALRQQIEIADDLGLLELYLETRSNLDKGSEESTA